MPLYIVCSVFDIVLFSVQNYCNQDICNRIYTSFRHDAHNTLYLLFLRMYILQKYTVSFFCIHVSFLLNLYLYWWLMYCYFYCPAFCFYHCKYYYCWCFVAILWPHIASRDYCYTILMLPNPHLHYSSSSFEYMSNRPLLIESQPYLWGAFVKILVLILFWSYPISPIFISCLSLILA